MTHIMIDLETLSSDPHAAVIQIGAVAFELTGDIGMGFEITIDVEDAMRHGEVSASTLRWWMGQPDSARKAVMAGGFRLHRALEKLNTFIEEKGGKDPLFWAHATFDFPVLMHAYTKVGLKSNLPYRRMRDLRTLEMACGEFITWGERIGTHHTAMSDAFYQAEHAKKMLQHLDTMVQVHKERDR